MSVLYVYDRRINPRFKVKTDVRVKSKNGKSKFCKADNISAHGVGILTLDLALKVNEVIELTFIVDLGKVSKMHRRRARVIHTTNGLTGCSMYSFGE